MNACFGCSKDIGRKIRKLFFCTHSTKGLGYIIEPSRRDSSIQHLKRMWPTTKEIDLDPIANIESISKLQKKADYDTASSEMFNTLSLNVMIITMQLLPIKR